MMTEKLTPESKISFGGRQVPTWMVILISITILLAICCITLAAVLGLNTTSTKITNNVVTNNNGSSGSSAAQTGSGNLCVSTDCLRAAARMITFINSSVNPCDNFYQYACGGWMNRMTLLPYRSYRTVLSDVRDINQNKLNRLLSAPVLQNTPNYERKIKNFFRSCVNQYENEKLKGSVLLKNINKDMGGWFVTNPNVISTFDFEKVFEQVHVDYWVNALFSYTVATDESNTKARVIETDLGGLGMSYPYYLRSDTVGVQVAYKKFITNVASLFARDSGVSGIGTNAVANFVTDVYEFEKKLAQVINASQPSQDPYHSHNRVAIKDLAQVTGSRSGVTSSFDWLHFFQHMFGSAVTDNTQIIMLEKEYLTKVFTMINTYSDVNVFRRVMSNYLIWRVMDAYVQDLSWEYVHANREFYVATTGRTGFLGTWRFCFNLMADKMGTALGSLFVRDHFSDSSKTKIHQMVALIKTTLTDRLDLVSWMDSATKTKAKGKLLRAIDKLGYPDLMINDNFLDAMYKGLTITTTYFDNILNMARFEKVIWSQRLSQGEDRRLWIYDTYDVVAHFYNPWNELIVPAGMMQFPLYTNNMPAFWEFGSIGMIMANQLMHAVDYYGNWYDAAGDIVGPDGWWDKSTRDGYNNARKCVVQHYTNRTVGPYRVTGYPNGVKVLIHADSFSNLAVAETGGLKMTYYAYQSYKQKNGEKIAPGLGKTSDQSFFIAYAQSNCFIRRDAYAFRYAMSGRVPEDLKTNGALSQLPEFVKAFNCPANSKMNAPVKCNMFP